MSQDKNKTKSPNVRVSKRDAILAEATQLFNDQGYHDTRLEDIAAKIGTGKTNISYHFKNKETLLEEDYGLACDFSDAEIDVAAKAKNGLERAIAFIRAHFQAHANAMNGQRSALTLLSDFSAFHEPEHSQITARFDKHIHSFKQFLQQGINDGSVEVASVEAATFFVFSVLHWIPRWLEAIPEKNWDTSIDGICDLLRHGLAIDIKRAPAKPLNRANIGDYPAIFDRKTRNKLKRAAFLRTGTRYLNKNGFRSLSLDEIAKELGVTRGAFYYHIADKETLFINCFERTCDLIEESQILAAEGDAIDAVSELEQAIRCLFEGHVTNLDPLLRLNLTHALAPAPRVAIQARLRRLRATYAELIGKGMMDGSIRPIDLEATEHIVFGAIFAASGQRYAATKLYKTWQPIQEPVAASAAYFQPLLTGLASH
jgi:AcrR family transcriptional regulator